jgi:hypothetical protein
VRWLVVLLYPLLIFRTQLPLGESDVQLTTLVLLALAVAVGSIARSKALTVNDGDTHHLPIATGDRRMAGQH